MADRTWNGIDARMWEEFPAVTAVVLAMIISKCPNEHGIYDLPRYSLYRFLSEIFGANAQAELDKALDWLENAGVIRRYPLGSVWIVKKFKRARFKHLESNQLAACRDISVHNVETLTDFMSAYCPDIKAANVGTTDPDPDPDPEKEKTKSKTFFPSDSAEPTRRTQKRPAAELARARTPEEPRWVALAKELDYFIRMAIAKHNVPHPCLSNDPETCARELRLLVDKDGYDEASIFPALVWAWDYEFPSRDGHGKVNYGSVLLSIANWRPTKFGKMYAQWLQHTNGDLQEGAKIRRAIQNKLSIHEVTA